MRPHNQSWTSPNETPRWCLGSTNPGWTSSLRMRYHTWWGKQKFTAAARLHPRSQFSLLMVNLPSKLFEALSENTAYVKRASICGPRCERAKSIAKKKSLPANLWLLFGLPQGSNQETASYLGFILNIILRGNYVRQDFSNPLINLISINHLEQSHYQRVTYRYNVGSFNWSNKEIYSIEI